MYQDRLKLQHSISSFELFTTQSRVLTPLEEKAFENIVGKEENASN